MEGAIKQHIEGHCKFWAHLKNDGALKQRPGDLLMATHGTIDRSAPAPNGHVPITGPDPVTVAALA
jgi:hypothetical protein